MTFIRQIGLVYIIPFIIYLINPFNKGFLFGYLLTLALILKGKKLIPYLDRDFIFLSLFAITYALFYAVYQESGIQFIFIYALFPSFFYLFGKYLVLPKMRPNHLVLLFFSIGILFSFSQLLSVILNLRQGGFSQIDRGIPYFWNGKISSATQVAAYFTFNMCLPIIFLVKRQGVPLLLNFLTGTFFIASLLSVFRVGSRTLLLICILAILASLLYVVPRQSRKVNLRLFLFLGLFLIILPQFINLNLNADYLSVLGTRLQESNNTSSAGGRTSLWLQSLENIFKYPMGWQGPGVRYSHNLWLDVARYAGLIPFFLLLMFTFRSIRNTYKAVRKTPQSLLLNTTIITFSLSSILVFFVEPIMEGLFFLFTVFCVFQGMINAYLKMPRIPIIKEN